MNATAVDLLDQLFEESVNTAVQEPPATAPTKQAIKRLNYSHDGMIDLIIANPGISQNEIAARIGYSAAWVSTVMATDAFQAKVAARRDEIIDPALKASVKEQFEGILRRSMSILAEKLEGTKDSIPDNLVLRSVELSSRALGYGARTETIAVQVNVDNHLEDLGERMVSLLHRKKAETITVDVGDEG